MYILLDTGYFVLKLRLTFTHLTNFGLLKIHEVFEPFRNNNFIATEIIFEVNIQAKIFV